MQILNYALIHCTSELKTFNNAADEISILHVQIFRTWNVGNLCHFTGIRQTK